MHKVISHNTVFPRKIKLGDLEGSPILDTYMDLKPKPERDVLLIIGDGRGVREDIAAWYDLAEGIIDYDTICVNYSPLVCPHETQHYAAGDAHMPDMRNIAESLSSDVLKHAWNPNCPGFDLHWQRNGRGGWSGTSGNLAFRIGMSFDYTRIVMAGCPMDNSGNWYSDIVAEDDVKANKDHRHHLWKWTELASRPIGKFVRSMSGNTRDLLGEPTREWLLHIPETKEN